MNFIDKHKIVRRLTLLWAICLITYVTVKIMSHMEMINDSIAQYGLGVIGLLATVIAFYQYSRHKDG